MRGGVRDLIAAGFLVILAFYTRLNNLPMALAVAAFALPVTLPAVAMWRPRVWWPLVRWRVVFAILGALALGAVLFAWPLYYRASSVCSMARNASFSPCGSRACPPGRLRKPWPPA